MDTITCKQILCPVDFSDFSDYAMRYAALLAQKFDAHLTLLHVVAPILVPLPGDALAPPMRQTDLADIADACRDRLTRTAGDLTKNGVSAVACQVTSGAVSRNPPHGRGAARRHDRHGHPRPQRLGPSDDRERRRTGGSQGALRGPDGQAPLICGLRRRFPAARAWTPCPLPGSPATVGVSAESSPAVARTMSSPSRGDTDSARQIATNSIRSIRRSRVSTFPINECGTSRIIAKSRIVMPRAMRCARNHRTSA